MHAYRAGSPAPEPLPPPRWGRALAAVGVFLLGTRVDTPLPGLDAEAVRAFERDAASSTSALSPPFLPLLGGALGAFVLVRGVTALATAASDAARRHRWRRNGLLLYLLGAAAQGLSLALYLEARTTADMLPLVPSPGWGVRLAAMAVSVAAAGLTWRLADEVTRARAAHGPLALLVAATLPAMADGAYELGASVAREDSAPLAALGTLALPLAPTALLLVALARWWPASWTRPLVRGVAPRSALDLVALVLLAGAQTASLARLAAAGLLAREGPSPGVVDAASSLRAHPLAACVGGALCAALLARWLRAGEHAPRRGPAAAAVALGVSAVTASVLGALVTAGGVPRHVLAELAPARAWTEVSLQGDTPRAVEDAPRLVARLRALHHRAEVIDATGDRVRLRVAPVEGDARDVVSSVLASARLEFYCASEDQSPLQPEDPSAAPRFTMRTMGSRPPLMVWTAPSLEALAPHVQRSESVPGALTRAGCDDPDHDGAPRRCFALRLDPADAVTGDDLASARAEVGPDDDRPYVSLRFRAAGAARFAALTTACVGRVLAIVLDGRIQSAPVVMTPITGGRAMLTGSTAGGPQRALARQRALAASLASGALATRWSLAP